MKHLKKERTGHKKNIKYGLRFSFFCHLNWSILTLSHKWIKLLKYSGLYNRPLLAVCIIGLYYRPVSDSKNEYTKLFC